MGENIDKLSDQKLCDIVKNYKAYNYPEELRNKAIDLLKERGYSMDYLQNNGYLNNVDRENALLHFSQYKRHSMIAGGLYTAYILCPIIAAITNTSVLYIAMIILIIAFIVEVIAACKAIENCYIHIQGKECPFNISQFLTLGIPFYLPLYFYYNKIISADIDEIR